MDNKVNKRETWSKTIDFVLALVGFSVGLGNIWRFPYLCYKNGGGCFLIPYLICLVFAGVPVLILEVCLGQFASQGGITAWLICPLFQGIGWASVIIVQFLNIYYIVILGWALFYMFASFQSELPWSRCGNDWNTPNCVDYVTSEKGSNIANTTVIPTVMANMSNMSTVPTAVAKAAKVSASEEYFEHRVLKLSTALDEPGIVNWEVALCLLLAWIICYLCVFKGVKSTGKVVYFTATFPYVLLTILLVRAVTLPGAAEGIKFYLTPNFTRLADGQVWLDAGTQVFFSYSIGLGTLIALGSYNRFHHNCYRDSIIFACVNSGTSFYGGFVIFSVLGFMAQKQGVEVKDVAKGGPGLAFIAYPEAVAQMPLAPLWSVLFFFMVFLLGLDSEFVGIEGFVTAIVDLFPKHLRRGYRKEMFIAFMCCIWFLIGLSMVTKGGMYVFQLFDNYSASGSALLWIALFQSIAIGWIYGGERFYDDMENMIGFRINPWLRWCWMIFTPIFCLGVFIFSLVTYSPLEYNGYKYPDWGETIGWIMALSSIVCIPIVMIYKLATTPGSLRERWDTLTTPSLKNQSPEAKRHDFSQASYKLQTTASL
ncbi:sodium- and chloride-dependent taurine transporter [Pocillopora verrucosa]|uniref:sodium- and chloride-dependent taurine transporter n=1 Tax=Pocillopora verrucosa TaxID=203993 RepID=UPI0027977235|nr:sodium- and chloride-dependent taurine transporter-like [Pocillopora verrucosa]